jgi:L-iditol 2-dehydrogenase
VQAVVTQPGGGLAVAEIPEPSIPESGGLVRVSLCGLCGSDAEKFLGDHTLPGVVLGHEVVGWLESPDGAPVRVALAHHVPCGVCSLCRSGHSSLCARFVETRLDPGGFAERLAVTAAHLDDAVFPLPPEVDDLAGTLLEPLSCVLRAVEAAAGLLGGFPYSDVAGAKGGDLPSGSDQVWDVLVAGCGSVGLLFLSVLASAQTGPVPWRTVRPGRLMCIDPDPERVRLAEGLGATKSDGSVAPRVAFVTAPGALPGVLSGMASGGLVVVFAGTAEAPSLDIDRMYRGELTLAGVRSGSPRHLRQALAALQAHLLPLDWYRPEVVDLAGLPEAAERYAQGEVLKVVLRL